MSLYSESSLKKKLKKLTKLYDMSKPRDVFTLTMQEMEVAEITAIIQKVVENEGVKKKTTVMSLLKSIAKNQEIDLDMRWVSAYIDDMAVATKCKYAINKDAK